MYRLWIHLQLLKRGGGGHHPGGVELLANGSMAVQCPVCPHPGRNVPVEMLDNE